MRIALLSDIHGNPIALDAVIRDIQVQGGVDMYWILGDMAAIGYDPGSNLIIQPANILSATCSANASHPGHKNRQATRVSIVKGNKA